MAKNENRNYVTLACQECKHENYTTSKNKKNTPEKLETKKYVVIVAEKQLIKRKNN